MTALAAARNTQMMCEPAALAYPIADNVKIYEGSLVMIVAGYAKPAAATAGGIVVGRARKTYDNTVTGHTLGALIVEVDRGTFNWVNGDTIVAADVGKVAYVTDDQTVQKAAGLVRAGFIRKVDGDGAWVETGAELAALDSETLSIQAGTVTLSAGVGTVATGISVTTASKVFVTMNTPAGTLGTWGYEVLDANLVVGGPGVGTIVVRAIDENKAAATSDTSTVNYLIVG